MAAAAKLGKSHGMLSIIGLEDGVLDDICAKVRLKLGTDIVCQTANYLFPTGRVVSGHKDALNEVQVQDLHNGISTNWEAIHVVQSKGALCSWKEECCAVPQNTYRLHVDMRSRACAGSSNEQWSNEVHTSGSEWCLSHKSYAACT